MCPREPTCTTTTLKIPSQPMYHLYKDLISPFPQSEDGNSYCLTICCVVTDYLFCLPIPNKEAETVVQAYLKYIYSLFGGSKVLITDNGSEFKNTLFKEVCKELNFTQHHITTYLPSSNLVEHHHGSLKKCIAKFCQRDASHWDKIVPYTCLTQNLFPHTLEGESAMFEIFGHGDKDTFIDLEALYCLYMQIALRLQKAHEKAKHDYSENSILPEVGDPVLFQNHNKTGFSSIFLSGYCYVTTMSNCSHMSKESFSMFIFHF